MYCTCTADVGDGRLAVGLGGGGGRVSVFKKKIQKNEQNC